MTLSSNRMWGNLNCALPLPLYTAPRCKSRMPLSCWMMFFSAVPVVRLARMCIFLPDRLIMRMNLTPAPTVVLPDAVVPSRKSARTPWTVLIKSIYLGDNGKLLLKTIPTDLRHDIRQLFGHLDFQVYGLFEQTITLAQELGGL